jgi:hypothetical protein
MLSTWLPIFITSVGEYTPGTVSSGFGADWYGCGLVYCGAWYGAGGVYAGGFGIFGPMRQAFHWYRSEEDRI